MEPMQQQTSSDEAGWAGQGRASPADIAQQDAEDAIRRLAILEQTVEQDVIPRMLLNWRAEAPAAVVALIPPKVVSESQVAGLVALVLAREEAKSIAFVEALHADGYPAETLYLDLLAPTARQLGQMWVDDDCDFTDVTVGLFLLQNSLRELGATHRDNAALNPSAPRILLVPLPREQHTFGLSMVYDFFRRAGWNAWSGTIESESELAGMVRGSWFDIVGFSLPCDEQIDDARAVIRMVRARVAQPERGDHGGWPGLLGEPGACRHDRRRRHGGGRKAGGAGGGCAGGAGHRPAMFVDKRKWSEVLPFRHGRPHESPSA